MNFDEIYSKTQYALMHNEVYELLNGIGQYQSQDKHVPASIPTHDEPIFSRGLYPLYERASLMEKNNIVLKITDALSRMINSENDTDVWWAFQLLYGQKYRESRGAPIVFADNFWRELSFALRKHQHALTKNQSYLGKGNPMGLWFDVERLAELMIERFDIHLFDIKIQCPACNYEFCIDNEKIPCRAKFDTPCPNCKTMCICRKE